MATVDDILKRQAYVARDETWTKDNNYPSYHLYVEPEYVPVTNKRIADFNDQISVRGEQNAQFVGFQLPRYDDGLDLTAAHLYIHYQTVYGGSDSVPCNVSKSDNYVRMCWQVPAQATQEPDRVQMMIYATGTNSMGERVTWKTLPTSYTIHDGLDIGGGIPEPDTSWYEQFVQQMEAQVSTAQGHADDAQASKTAAAGSATDAAESAAASAKALEDNRAYVESQKETFVGYNRRETDTKYANALIGSASGTGRVTVGDAWEAPVTDMDISGRSEQFSTTGAQLLDLSSVNKSAGGAVVNYADGGYSISGTGALTASFTASYTLDKNVLKPGNLILKSELTIPKLYVRIWDGNTVLAEMQGNSTKQITQEMIDNDNVRVECFLYAAAGNTITPGTYHPMLYQDGDGTWEPYTGFKPSPSPEYPQPIKGTGTVSTGAQMLDTSKILSKTYKGITFQNNGDGSFTIDGTATDYTNTYTPITLVPGTYVVSAKYVGTDSSPYQKLFRIRKNENESFLDYGLGEKFVVEDNDNVTYAAMFQVNIGETLNKFTLYPMLNAGATPKPWEPYTGGKPSPSSDYPQPLDVKVTGAQLLNLSGVERQQTVVGITYTVDSANGTITANGTSTQVSILKIPISIPAGEKVYLGVGNISAAPSGTFQTIFRLSGDNGVEDSSNTYLSVMNATNLFTTTQHCTSCHLRFGAGETVNNFIIKPMIALSDKPLPWEPYAGYQTATITLTEPLRGIGDYRDRIRCRDGEWGIERNRKIAIYDGVINRATVANEAWDTQYPGFVHCNLTRMADWLVGQVDFMSDAFPCTTEINRNFRNTELSCHTSNDGIYLFISHELVDITDDDSATRIAKVNAWIQSHNFKVEYSTTTPTWEPLPSATQSALNALTTYTGTTHVTVTAGGPEPDVGLGYVQDTRAVVADLQAQINEIRGGTT